jgi:hypothetical protein
MLKHLIRRAALPVILLAATALGGCVYSPYPYGYPYYASAYPAYVAPPVVGGVFIGGGYRRPYWR